MDQAVRCKLPTVAAWVQSKVKSCGTCGGQSGTGVDFLQVLHFPLSILTLLTTPHSVSSISRADPRVQLVGKAPCGLSFTQTHETIKRGGRTGECELNSFRSGQRPNEAMNLWIS